MKRAGCYLIQFGVESGDSSILDHYNKQISLEKVDSVFKACRRQDVRTVAHFILGLPEESKDSLGKTLDFAIKLRPDYASFNIASPRFGSQLRSRVSHDAPDYKNKLKLKAYAVRRFYFRPSYAAGLILTMRTPGELFVAAQNLYYLFSNLFKDTFIYNSNRS
jgi:radical SAM superfamily enzyme YgiQ (UPF0313 family)